MAISKTTNSTTMPIGSWPLSASLAPRLSGLSCRGLPSRSTISLVVVRLTTSFPSRRLQLSRRKADSRTFFVLLRFLVYIRAGVTHQP